MPSPPFETARQENFGIGCAWRNSGGNIFLLERITISITWESFADNLLHEGSIATFKPLKATMIPETIDGLAYKDFSYDQETGYVNIVVDTRKTNWQKVMAAAYNAQSGEVSGPSALFTFGDNPPNQYKPAGGLDKDVYANAWQPVPERASLGAMLGRYDESLETFFPEPTVSKRPGVAVRWNADDPHYRALLRLTFDDYTPISISLSKLTEDSMIPDTAYNTVSHMIDGSRVVYTDSSTQKKTLITGIRMPEQDLSVTCRIDNGGAQDCKVKDGVVQLKFEMPGSDTVKETSYTLRFSNPDGSFHSLSVITVCGVQGKPKPFPSYYSEMQPYSTASLSAELKGGIPGTGLTYDPELGILRFAVNSESLLAAKSYDPTLAQAKVTILPPEDAAYYEFGTIAGTNIYDPVKYRLQSPSGERRPIVGYRYDQDVGYDYTDFFKAESFTLHNGKTSWYITNTFPEYTGAFAGRVDYVYWYADADDEEPIHISYFIKKFDPIATITKNKIVSSRNDVLKKPVSSPCLILESRAGTAAELQASLYPSADKTQYYELEMLDASGETISLQQKATLFVPYPDEYDQESFMALHPAIIHYTDEMEIAEVFEDDIEYVPEGMFITVRSLSPFVLTWDDSNIAVDVAVLPDTGDHSAPIMWLMLAGASLLVLASARRAQRQN